MSNHQYIQIKLVGQVGEEHLLIHLSTELVCMLHFSYNDRRINIDDTPSILNMKDGNSIQVYHLQHFYLNFKYQKNKRKI